MERANHPPRFYVYCIKILKTVEWIQLKVSSLSIELGTLNLYQIGPIPCCLHQTPFTKLPHTTLKASSKLGLCPCYNWWRGLVWKTRIQVQSCVWEQYIYFDFAIPVLNWKRWFLIGMVYSFLASFFVNVAEFLGYLLNLVCFFFVNVSLMLRDPPGSIKCPKYSTGILT